MKRTLLLFAVAGIFSCFADAVTVPGTPRDNNNGMTPGYQSPSVSTELKVNIDEATGVVRFIQDNDDPYVVTKAYRLQNADPYIARGYVRSAIEAKQVNQSPVQVAAIKYSDGTAFLLVSAEEYRFQDSPNGEGIDTIIASLDRAGLATVSNDSAWVYFPKFLPAATLMNMLSIVGTNENDPQFAVSPDSMLVDAELNMLMVCAPDWSGAIIKQMLEQYDRPIPEVRVSYRIVEIYAENDDRIGLDFQSWKNNEGVDLFSAGARVRRNWSSFFHGGVDNNGSNRTSYWNFNPKWNTRYLDFLTSIGKARVLTSGSLLAKNREVSSITLNYGYFYERTDYSVDAGYGMGEFAYTDPNPNAIYRQQLAKILPETFLRSNYFSDLSIVRFTPRMIDFHDGVPIWSPETTVYDPITGRPVGVTDAVQSAILTMVPQSVLDNAKMAAVMQAISDGQVTGFRPDTGEPILTADGIAAVTAAVTRAAQEYIAAHPELQQALTSQLGTLFSFFSKGDTSAEGFPGVIHGKLQYPMAQDGFLFNLKLRPVVTGSAATIEFCGQTISLLGWNSDGSPRISDSSVSTTFQAAYGNQEFIIGGLRRTETVRSVAGLPFLKDIPVLGLLFSTENESIKQSQLVIIATVEFSAPRASGMTDAASGPIDQTLQNVNQGVDSKVGNMFFQQYGIDSDEIE